MEAMGLFAGRRGCFQGVAGPGRAAGRKSRPASCGARRRTAGAKRKGASVAEDWEQWAALASEDIGTASAGVTAVSDRLNEVSLSFAIASSTISVFTQTELRLSRSLATER